MIIFFAVFVVTIASSLEIINIGSAEDIDISLNGNPKLAQIQEPLAKDDESSLEQCSEKSKDSFSFYDYSVVIAMLTVSLKIGVFYGYFHKSSLNSADFMLGSEMGLFTVTLSLATSFVTAIELLGNPAEMFFYGTQFSLIGELMGELIYRRQEKFSENVLMDEIEVTTLEKLFVKHGTNERKKMKPCGYCSAEWVLE